MERKPVAARVSLAADAYITKLAAECEVSRADAFRAMLAVASQHPDEVKAKLKQMKEAFA